MTDLTKTIEELKALEIEATPGPWSESALYSLLRYGRKGSGAWDDALEMANWTEKLPDEDDAALIVAMRNALPELLELETRAEKAEAERDWLALQLQRIHNGCATRAAEAEWWLKRAECEAAKAKESKEVKK